MSDSDKDFESGTWQATLTKSAVLFDRSGKARKQASALLWDGAQNAIEEWISDSDSDVNGENLYSEVLDILGTPRKGDASKIRSVALAVKNNGLVLSVHPNLSKAYAEATRLTKTVKQHAAEDKAADEAVAKIQQSAPKSSSTPEGAAMIVLSKGVDEAARLLLDALGATDTAAHRSLLRAISQEISGRVQPAPKPAKKAAAPKGKATKGAVKKAAAKSGADKPKPAKPKPVTKAKVEAEEPSAPEADDMFDMLDDEQVEAEATTPKPKGKAKPVRRGPVKRS